MTELTRVLWLEEIGKEDLPVVGGKGANLGEMIRAGFPVPPGFCLTTAAYQEFLTENSLEEGVERIRLCLTDRARLEEEAGHMQSLIKAGKFSTVARQEILTAYRRLLTKGVPQGLVAVRSSAVGEDLAEASFAGQQETVLNVADATELLDAIRSCWASLWTVRAVHYRQDQWQETIGPTMAVVVQAMIPSQGAGVAFSADPLTGEEVIVIEAAWGLGQGVVAGEVEADHYRVSKEALEEVGPAFVGNKRWQRVWHPGAGPGTVLVEVPPADRERPVLNATQVKELAGLVRALDQYFGCPQDVEWGLWNGKFYLFQTRPVTGRPSGFFTERIAGDDHLWTSGFFNERFPQPVSPLGWSLIRELVEELAFLDPLRFLGVPQLDELPLTKLYRGHPFVNVAIFQMLYKLFPTWLLPDDAGRYFPSGQTELRKKVKHPRSVLVPRTFLPLLWTLFREAGRCWPWLNYRHWARFTHKHEATMEQLSSRALSLSVTDVGTIWQTIEEARQLDRELLAIHRWSLTHADLTYTLLRKLLAAWFGTERGGEISARLVGGLSSRSVEIDGALYRLARLACREGGIPPQAAAGGESSEPELSSRSEFAAAFADFLERYGHRSFSLDIYHPPFASEPGQVLRLLAGLLEGEGQGEGAAERKEALALVEATVGDQRLGRVKPVLFRHLLTLTDHYMRLREEQRFYWQSSLALQRQLFLRLGEWLVEQGVLSEREDIFFVTKDELQRMIKGQTVLSPRLVEERRVEYEQLKREHELAPHLTYPNFLRGNQPLIEAEQVAVGEGRDTLRGRPVSPGMGRGRVRIVISPSQFDKIRPGDILVTQSPDPGWTPIFGKLGGLIMERGGQLSHGAVVAREYGLPAVSGIPAVTQQLQDGQLVLVDGRLGTVTLLAEENRGNQKLS